MFLTGCFKTNFHEQCFKLMLFQNFEFGMLIDIDMQFSFVFNQNGFVNSLSFFSYTGRQNAFGPPEHFILSANIVDCVSGRILERKADFIVYNRLKINNYRNVFYKNETLSDQVTAYLLSNKFTQWQDTKIFKNTMRSMIVTAFIFIFLSKLDKSHICR